MKIIDTIDRFIAGDWGEESYSESSPCQVSCIRGADFVPIEHHDFSHVPTRYISKQSFEKKCLQIGDIIVEKSGGSPTQSTGRLSFVSKELIDSAGDVVCTNFCVAFRVKKEWNPLYVFYYLQHIYNNGVFFNFEGKTSGLRNLNLDAAFTSIPIDERSSWRRCRRSMRPLRPAPSQDGPTRPTPITRPIWHNTSPRRAHHPPILTLSIS